ncbi:MAG: type II toxin-antitoxin system RelE/ParE family toxin [Phascolarctobacterium sp.]|nr:type II toxin-antitoxin system RelE/ParE family toxin [Phascolarctobacterium sp.]
MPKKFNIHFYKSDSGREPVKEYLEILKQSKNTQDQKLLMEISMYLTLLSERGSSLGTPYVKHLRNDLWELRPKSDRIIYCTIKNNNIYLLHNFKKTSQKTPIKEIRTALLRNKKLVNSSKR